MRTTKKRDERVWSLKLDGKERSILLTALNEAISYWSSGEFIDQPVINQLAAPAMRLRDRLKELTPYGSR